MEEPRYPIVDLDIGHVCNKCLKEWNHECTCNKDMNETTRNKIINCLYCGETLESGIALINEEKIQHRKLPKNSGAHLGCYVEMLCHSYLKRKDDPASLRKHNCECDGFRCYEDASENLILLKKDGHTFVICCPFCGYKPFHIEDQ